MQPHASQPVTYALSLSARHSCNENPACMWKLSVGTQNTGDGMETETLHSKTEKKSGDDDNDNGRGLWCC